MRRRDPALGPLQPSRGHPQEGGLAGAVAAHQCDPLARLEHEVDAAKDVPRTSSIIELRPEVGRLEHRGGTTAPAAGIRRRLRARRDLLAAEVDALAGELRARPLYPDRRGAQAGELEEPRRR